jgi:O-antigen/teichoic acid export membrane protein
VLFRSIIASRFRPFYGILLQGGRPGTHTLVLTALTITVVALNLLLIPILGIYGAALAVVMMYALEATLISYNARRLFKIRL